MIEEHFAEALIGPEIEHPVRICRHVPRTFRCGELTAEEIDCESHFTRMFGNSLFIEDQKFGYHDLTSDEYRNAAARDTMRGLRFE